MRVGGSHASLPCKDGVTQTVDVRTHHQNGSKESHGRCTNLSTRMVVKNRMVGVRTHPPSIRTVPLPFQGRTITCVPLKGGKDPPWRVGGSHASLPFKDGVTRRVGVRTHHQNGSKELNGRCRNPSISHAAGSPSLFPGTRPFLFVTAVAGKDKALCPPATETTSRSLLVLWKRGKGPACG